MKIWIVGKGGLLGSTLTTLCKSREISVVATGSAEVDITDHQGITNFVLREKPTHLVNCAAYTAVDLAEREKERAFAINAIGPENLAKVARNHSLRLIHLSTNYIFDGKSRTPYSEEDVAHPLSIYGMSKWEGEKKVVATLPNACVIRTSWLFGNGGKNFVSSLLHTLKTEKVVRAAADQWGRVTSAQDLAEAVLCLLSSEGVFHFANRGSLSRYEIACAIKESANRKGVVIKTEKIVPAAASEFTTPAPRPEMAVLSTDKFEKKMPIRSWDAAFEEYLNALT
ncbi:MAG: dTDP-4-dehydrorhamnose reductase [Chlamydiales bacterium]